MNKIVSNYFKVGVSGMKGLFFLLTIAAILVTSCTQRKKVKSSDNKKDKSNLQYVDLNIGAVGHLLHPVRPNIQLPNQAIRMHPVRKDYIDDQISYFSLSMVSHREGELFGVLPGSGSAKKGTWNTRQTYDHDLEVLQPYYYNTYLIDEDIKTEFTPGKKAGFFRFSFPKNSEKRLKLNILHSGSWSVESDKSVSGVEEFGGMKAWVFIKFDRKAEMKTDSEVLVNKRRNTSRVQPLMWLTFKKKSDKPVNFKYAVSYISLEQAKKNLEKEIPNWDFKKLKKKARKEWEHAISQIEVKGGTKGQKRSFYSALFRTYERMVNITEDGRYYSAFDHKVHTDNRDFYIDDWVWDTYLAHHPLRVILNPQMEADMMHSYVRMYEQLGWMPQFPLLFGDKPAMNGFHSTITILDDYRKGIRDFDVEKAYEGAKKNATDATMLPWKNGPKTVLHDFYRKNGYFPALRKDQEEWIKEVHSFEKRQAVAVTLGHSYDDWALAELAKELGKTDDYNYFYQQSKNYRNVFNPETSMMWPKDEDGNWIDIDPKFDGGPGGREYYDENNGYTYAWQVQYDIPGLIELMGGKEKFTDNLDNLFREGLGRTKYQYWARFADATGMTGQFSMGNEVSLHIPYLFNYAGQAWKTQKRIRQLLDVWFQDNIFGIPGDEDGGGLTSFVVFSSMGFYPVTPGVPVYTIGSPLFEEVKIKLHNGNTFTIKAHNCSVKNKYIQSAKLNGKKLNSPWFTHEQLMNGATIELEMGKYPNKKWGDEGYKDYLELVKGLE